MNEQIYILVNGILTNPEDVGSWTDRAEEWIDMHSSFKATKMEYRAGIFTRRLYQNTRVQNLKKICKAYLGDRIVLVGHSNGCDIIQRMATKGTVRIHELHLIAGASDHDFRRNGYNRVLRHGAIDKIFVYVSDADKALKNALLSTHLFGWLGLGYGYLGLVGPTNVDPLVKDRVIIYKEPMDHSQWFNKHFFEKTMNCILGK
jgi:pimeloyl-ACP methyl ester carboxylesterase